MRASVRQSAVYVTPPLAVGSKYKYMQMFSRVCNTHAVSQFPASREHDLAILIGYKQGHYQALKASGTPYIFVANDVFGMRWAQPNDGEAECARNATHVMTNTPDTLKWLQDNYGVEGGSVVYLRPLAADLDFEPLPKLPGKNIVYAGGMVVDNEKYSYRDYREIFAVLQEGGWTVHCYPAWGHHQDLPHYEAMGCVIHEPVLEGRDFYRELSQYQVGLQGYAHGSLQPYIEAARPNKLWTYLAAGIPTVGYNTGGGGAIYAGKWGTISRTLTGLPRAASRAENMTISEEIRRGEVLDNDLDAFQTMVDAVSPMPPLRVGFVAKSNICGQVSLVPKVLREHSDAEAYGFYQKEHPFTFAADDHGKEPTFLQSADVIQFDVTHDALDIWKCNPAAALVAYQHGHMDRPGDASRSELELDVERGVTRVVSSIDRLTYVDGDASRWMPCVLDPHILDMKAVPRDNGIVRVVHSPSRRANKQTEYIIAAVELLQRLGEPVELDLIENVTIAECLERKAQGDICFDQLARCYGMAGVEAMYLGIPVVVGMDDSTDEKVVEIVGYRPYARAGYHDLVLVLLDLIRDPEKRRVIGEAGALYARTYHTPEAVVERRMELYRSVAFADHSDVTLGVSVEFNDRHYPKGSSISRPLAYAMRDAGVIKGEGLDKPKKPTQRAPLKYPVRIARNKPPFDFNGRSWRPGDSIDHPTALAMKQAGHLTDARIV